MTIMKLFGNKSSMTLAMLTVVASLMTPPAFSYEIDESNTFIEGLAAYQQGIFSSAINILENWIKEYPDSLILDLGLYWLAQSYYQVGNQREAARYISLFFSVYPESPLIATIDHDFKNLAKRY